MLVVPQKRKRSFNPQDEHSFWQPLIKTYKVTGCSQSHGGWPNLLQLHLLAEGSLRCVVQRNDRRENDVHSELPYVKKLKSISVSV